MRLQIEWDQSIFSISLGILGLWLNAGLLVKIRKQIHKDVLIANLAISNIGLCVFAFPFSSTAAFQHEWVASKVSIILN